MPDQQDRSADQEAYQEIASIEEAADAEARRLEGDKQPKNHDRSQLPHHPLPEERAEAEKAQRQKNQQNTPVKRPRRPSKKQLLIGLAGLLAALAAAWFVPASRYLALNLMGVRGSLEISSQDEAGGQGSSTASIKRFTVKIDDRTYDSGQSATLTVSGLKFGRHQVSVSKQGYNSYQTTTAVDFNPFFGILLKRQTLPVMARLKAVGTPVSFVAKDWVSGLPITAGQFTVADRTVTPDGSGKVTVIAPPSDNNQVRVSAAFSGSFLDRSFDLPITGPPQEVVFMPSARDYFISNRDGGYNIYSSLLDGSDVKLLVKGAPQETSASLRFSVSPSGKYGVMVSQREGVKDSTGGPVSKIYQVDLATGAYQKIDEGGYSPNIYGWSGDWLTYSYNYVPDKSTDYSTRLVTRNLASGQVQEIYGGSGWLTGQVFITAKGVAFPEMPRYQPGVTQTGVTVYWAPYGSGARALASGAKDLVQTDFNRLVYGSGNGSWSELNTDSGQIRLVSQPPASTKSFWPVTSGGGERIISQTIDGQINLIARQADGKERTVTKLDGTVTGIGNLRFVDSTNLVYLAVGPGYGWSDYVVSLRGGSPHKITNVTSWQ